MIGHGQAKRNGQTTHSSHRVQIIALIPPIWPGPGEIAAWGHMHCASGLQTCEAIFGARLRTLNSAPAWVPSSLACRNRQQLLLTHRQGIAHVVPPSVRLPENVSAPPAALETFETATACQMRTWTEFEDQESLSAKYSADVVQIP